MTIEELFKEWLIGRAAATLASTASNRCGSGIATSPPRRSRGCAYRLSQDPALIVRFQDELVKAGLGAGVAGRRS